VKNAADCAKSLTALIKKLPPGPPAEFPEQDDPVAVLVQSFLLADATTEKALTAYKRLREKTVDFNDMRVTMPHEMVDLIGARYPQATDRCQRLRAALRHIYLREHQVSLEPLADAGKRDVKKYVESLDGMIPFASARLMLLCFDTHAVPVDEQLRGHLVAAGAADESADVADLSTWLARQVKASEGQAVHLAFQAWMDKDGTKSPAAKGRAAGARKTSKRAPASKTKTATTKTTKKKTTKKTTRKSGGKTSKKTSRA
jgi:endonuclease III